MVKGGPKIILGFDETNNGFELDSPDYTSHEDSVLIVTGYLGIDPKRANYGNGKYEGKRKIFNKKRDLTRALKRGKYYLEHNPNFLYTIIPRKESRRIHRATLRAQAIALLTFKFFLLYNLTPKNTKIIIDEIDGRKSSRRVNEELEYYLSKAFLKLPHTTKKQADKKVVAVKKADRAGYYIAAMKFLGEKEKWPYHRHRIPLSDLEKLSAQVSSIE